MWPCSLSYRKRPYFVKMRELATIITTNKSKYQGAFLSASICYSYLICQCSEYDDSRASIELSYGCTGAAPVNWTPENTNIPASRIVSAETESIMPLYLITG